MAQNAPARISEDEARALVESTPRGFITLAEARSLNAPRSTEDLSIDDHVLHVKWFAGGRWSWFACEYDAQSRTFFGYVRSGLGPDCSEWGSISVDDLVAMFGARLPVRGGVTTLERDRYWQPVTFAGARSMGEVDG